jgi:hypothetical protein
MGWYHQKTTLLVAERPTPSCSRTSTIIQVPMIFSMHKTSLTAVCLELCYYAASILYLKVCKLMLVCLYSEMTSLKMGLIFIGLILACLLSSALADSQGLICRAHCLPDIYFFCI